MDAFTTRILADLNPPQREAVETIDGPLLILAGAGSGKTRVVTRRIANLIAHGARPWEILAITFTNKAAGEMRQRVEALLDESTGSNTAAGGTRSNVWVSTFHSFCARLLRREAEAIGYGRDFSIYDEEDASGAIKDILKELGLAEDKRYAPRIVRQQISSYKSQALRPEELDESMFHERTLKEIYSRYEAALKRNQALDFDDLLRQAVLLFRDRPEILARYQQRFRFVLVDEYQDTNACQYHLVKMLGCRHRNVCATGDPDQSIYGWRGADVRNILSFEKDFPEAKVVKLEQNYRSTGRILKAADGVIRNNAERKHKSLWTESAEGELITLTIASDEQDEANQVVRELDRHVRDGRRYNEIAVFYRTNAQSRAFETALIEASIPYQLVGGTAFYERREVKDALAYLRLVVNPHDDAAFRRILNVPRRGLGDSALELIEQQAEKRGCSLLETLDGAEAEAFFGLFKPKPRQGIIKFTRLFDELRAMPQYPVADVMRTMLEKSGLREALLDADEMERVENLDQLHNAAVEFDKENNPQNISIPEGAPEEPGAFDGLEEMAQRQASLSGFLENSALMTQTDNLDTELDRVTLMTLHMAKGLEFPIVFLTGMEEGLCPLLRGDAAKPWSSGEEDGKAIEEERRLVYVGITRARERLYLSRACVRMKYGRTDIAIPSRFLSEIPDKLLKTNARATGSDVAASALGYRTGSNIAARGTLEQRRNTEPDESADPFEDFARIAPAARTRPSSRRDTALQTIVDRMLDVSDSQEDLGALEVGDRVRHAKFGDGVIESLSGSNLSMKAKVHFRNAGPKILLLSLAKLEKL